MQYAKKDVMDDDILDALAVLWSAKRIQSNQASFLPQAPEKPNMQIVY
jgi:predicted RNase H-like nuclease